METAAGGADNASRRPGIAERLEYAGFRLVVGLFRLLPLDVASNLSGWLWRAIAPLLRRQERAMRNLGAAMPELDPARKRAILLDMWEMLGRTFAEAMRVEEIISDPRRLDWRIPADVQALMLSGSGFVIISLHMGNWEIAAPLVDRMGIPVAGVYQRIKNPLVDAFVTRMRAPFYKLGLIAKGHGSVSALKRAVASGGGVAVLNDLRDHTGLRVPFFGSEAPSSPFPALLARGKAVPLIAGRVRRSRGCRFELTCELVPVQRSADRQGDVLAATAAIQAVFERWIREDPGQWMWAHRRWG